MKVKASVLSELACKRLYDLIDGELGNTKGPEYIIDETIFCLEIKRQIWLGKKRIIIDIKQDIP